jgi:hypothetical protein
MGSIPIGCRIIAQIHYLWKGKKYEEYQQTFEEYQTFNFIERLGNVQLINT